MIPFKRVMVTGHRPKDLKEEQCNFARTALLNLSKNLRKSYGMQLAISGLALGADTWWAQSALMQNIPLAVFIPFEGQNSNWPAWDALMYDYIRKQADYEKVVCESPSKSAYHARNAQMVTEADLAIAVWCPSRTTGGTATTVDKIKAAKKPWILVDLDELTIVMP